MLCLLSSGLYFNIFNQKKQSNLVYNCLYYGNKSKTLKGFTYPQKPMMHGKCIWIIFTTEIMFGVIDSAFNLKINHGNANWVTEHHVHTWVYKYP